MPIVDVYGEISPQVEWIVDVTTLQYGPLVQELLPNGRAWDRDDPVLAKLCLAESIELSRVAVRAAQFERELNPNFTFELLTDWETSYGLPDCVEPDTLEGRRAALRTKLLAQAGHDQSYEWWQGIVESLGYELHFIDLGPSLMTCIDDCVDEMTDEGFAWVLAVDHGDNDELLECVVDKNALLISYPIVHYLWEATLIPAAADLTGIAGTHEGFVVACDDSGRVFQTVDFISWAAYNVGVTAFRAICQIGSVFVAVGGVGNNATLSEDGGSNWFSYGFITDDLFCIHRGPLDDLVAVAGGTGGKLWRTTDIFTWTNIASPTAKTVRGMAAGTGTMVAVGDTGLIMRSTNNGASFTLQVAFTALHFLAVSGHLTTYVLVGQTGTIYRSTDGGLNWILRSSGTVQDLNAVTWAPSGRWTIAGNAGTILHSFDDGDTWIPQTQTTVQNLNGAGYYLPEGTALLVGNAATFVLE